MEDWVWQCSEETVPFCTEARTARVVKCLVLSSSLSRRHPDWRAHRDTSGPSTMVLNASCNTFRLQDRAVAGLFGLLHTVVQPSVHHRLQYHGPCRVHCRLCRLRVPVRILLSKLQVELAFRKTAFFLPAPSGPFWIWSEARSSSYRCVSKFKSHHGGVQCDGSGLAVFGRKSLFLAENQLPGVCACREEFGLAPPFKGLNITGSFPIPVLWASVNFFSTQVHAVAVFAKTILSFRMQ